MLNTAMTLPALLRHQATTRGDASAFTFMDGAVLGTGHPETLTWNQLYRRVLSLAEVQAEPLDTASPLMPMISDSPST